MSNFQSRSGGFGKEKSGLSEGGFGPGAGRPGTARKLDVQEISATHVAERPGRNALTFIDRDTGVSYKWVTGP